MRRASRRQSCLPRNSAGPAVYRLPQPSPPHPLLTLSDTLTAAACLKPTFLFNFLNIQPAHRVPPRTGHTTRKAVLGMRERPPKIKSAYQTPSGAPPTSWVELDQ
jgi:hypothetical protein